MPKNRNYSEIICTFAAEKYENDSIFNQSLLLSLFSDGEGLEQLVQLIVYAPVSFEFREKKMPEIRY